MKHLRIGLLLPSDIISLGIERLISHIKDVSVKTEKFSYDDLIPHVASSSPDLFIADASILGLSDIELIKANGVSFVIGISVSALPLPVRRYYDEVISIYDPTDTVLSVFRKAITDDSPGAQKELSPRERDVVIGVAKGLSNKEIALSMNVSVNTVMTHRRNISSKLEIHSPAGLTIFAIVTGLVSMDEIKSVLPE